jgi:4'-phosphopantetheinyl transferase
VELRLKEDLAPVRIWRVELDIGPEEEAKLRTGLTADELARAKDFASEEARHRYAVARGILRALLGSLLNTPPRSVPIEAGPGGKPRLAGNRSRLHFNLSHSGHLALIAIADREVGIDLEAIRPVPSALEIARRRFAPAEARFVEEGDEGEIDRRFLLCWTRKEALVKAVGAGLGVDLRSFAVPLAGAGGIVSIDGFNDKRAQSWRIVDVPIGDEHLAAVAWAVVQKLRGSD